MSLCFCPVFHPTPVDLDFFQESFYDKFLLSVFARFPGLGHFQNNFHCHVSAFGRMQLHPCREKNEMKDPLTKKKLKVGQSKFGWRNTAVASCQHPVGQMEGFGAAEGTA